MFMLRNVGKYFLGDTSKESVIEIEKGQLYLVRPLSPKGYSELIFKDAAARIRKTGQEYQYQLVVQRAYEEGEEELLNDEEGEDREIAALGERDEKIFLLDESLHFRCEIREGGEKILAWRDLSGDTGDLYEFVCDNSINDTQVQQFESIAVNCQYERRYRKSYQSATVGELSEFVFDNEESIPNASPVQSPVVSPTMPPVASSSALRNSANSSLKREKQPTNRKNLDPSIKEEAPTVAPEVSAHPEAISILAEETAELHLFDFQSGSFIIQDSAVTATVSEVGTWKYYLKLQSKERDWLGQEIVADLNPVFNFEYLSFIFNAYTPDHQAYSWLLRFKDTGTISSFQEGLMQALWEQLNEIKWNKSKESDRDYVLEAFQDLTMEEAPQEEEEEEEYEEKASDDGKRSEHYDSDEEEDDVVTRDSDGNVNSEIAVGYKHDRSFVVRGSKIGVFKHLPNNTLEFSTNISKVEKLDGKIFSPKKVMLHQEDNNMILQDGADPSTLYKMDLNYGKIVDEWKVHDDITVNNFVPESKFSQTTGEQTFLGMSSNALYRVDPRLAGNKLVDAQLKQYVSKNDFSAAATTEKGYIAVASTKGDIRMFDRLGINAKTHIPALGDPIIGLDVSADGRWVLATCRTYLLLIDTMQKDGKNEGKLGFEKSFGKDSKPQPRRLGLTPAHVAQFQHETGIPLSFTTARFNTGVESTETSIITATGPFIVTWNLKKAIQNIKNPYSIKRYEEVVKADNFKFGSDKNVIVALPNEVNMVAKHEFKKPTRESIATAGRVGGSFGGGRRSSGRIGTRESGRYKLGKEDIVDSPY
ncbi:VID27 cytoplasmic protein-domain-containing protein [Calycina marina]|uniref:VID27 cytoplasmic protein-domain-containing protein n=1 Tax=Calycina marina TaxID=1763456 RepID=A0A9P7YZ90_9HELO|nr:VID27 cytoplasmic protein-domain-containing protein [Calycina marina]